MPLTTEIIALVTERVGRWNTDIMLGWETALMGKQRVGRRLFNRCAPEHLTGTRLSDWYDGFQAGTRYKESIHRGTRFLGDGPNGPMSVTRKGWVARAKVVTQMERAGAFGTVTVFYLENGTIKRQVNCGI